MLWAAAQDVLQTPGTQAALFILILIQNKIIAWGYIREQPDDLLLSRTYLEKSEFMEDIWKIVSPFLGDVGF